jgi:predicted RNA binding protein YcfA (HicA-like mRNA interferase family)
MSVDYSRLRSLRAREIVRALRRDGFKFVRQKGDHHRYHHPDGRRVTVAYSNPGDTFLLRDLKSMIEVQARWTEDDLRRLKLVK